ncbi:MAG: YceI family protein [Bacteroidia bacterium]|nr:YceI family protein [Bacteroidia bacterium]
MKTIKTLSLIAFASLFLLAFTEKKTSSIDVNVENSKVAWKGYKVTGEHSGTINLKSGSFEYEEDKLVGGTFIIDMTSLVCTDLEGEYKGKLEGHLKSADFFGVEKYPTSKLEITKVVERGTPGDYKLVGNLTIKENTQEIKFNASVVRYENVVKSMADITIDRSDFDVKYGSGSFFDNLGDKTIYDEFDLKIQMVAGK